MMKYDLTHVMRRIEAIEKRQDQLDNLVRTWNKKLTDARHLIRHYLSKRMPLRTKYVEAMKHCVKVVDEFKKLTGRGFGLVRSTKQGQHVLFMCTHNQAEKLRRMADKDNRHR